MLKNKKGFTLIELLIVIVIIGILAVIVVGLVATNSKNRANDARAKADMRELQTALEQYRIDQDSYPATLDALAAGNYLSSLPKRPDQPNPPGTNYDYTVGNPATTYTLTYTLQNSNDKGPNITGGVYTLTQKQ
jgi:type II secretion system protein G